MRSVQTEVLVEKQASLCVWISCEAGSDATLRLCLGKTSICGDVVRTVSSIHVTGSHGRVCRRLMQSFMDVVFILCSLWFSAHCSLTASLSGGFALCSLTWHIILYIHIYTITHTRKPHCCQGVLLDFQHCQDVNELGLWVRCEYLLMLDVHNTTKDRLLI